MPTTPEDISTREQLQGLIHKGPLTDLFDGYQAWELCKVIGQHSTEINRSEFAHLFGTLQTQLIDRLVLAISRLFEVPDRYPTRSVPAVLNFLEEHSPRLIEPDPVIAGLRRLGARSPLSLCPKDVVAFLRDQLPAQERISDCAHSLAWRRVRVRRDKTVAHNEAVEVAIDHPTVRDLVSLLHLARDIVAPVSKGYANYFIVDRDGEFGMKVDVERQGLRLERLFIRAGLISEPAEE